MQTSHLDRSYAIAHQVAICGYYSPQAATEQASSDSSPATEPYGDLDMLNHTWSDENDMQPEGDEQPSDPELLEQAEVMDAALNSLHSDEEEVDDDLEEITNPYENYFLSDTFDDEFAWQIVEAASTPRPNKSPFRHAPGRDMDQDDSSDAFAGMPDLVDDNSDDEDEERQEDYGDQIDNDNYEEEHMDENLVQNLKVVQAAKAAAEAAQAAEAAAEAQAQAAQAAQEAQAAQVQDAREDEEEYEEDDEGYVRELHHRLNARPCDSTGAFLPKGTLPPPRPPPNPNSYHPFTDRVHFETADFIYSKNQMSASDIDFLSLLWASTLAKHNGTPPLQGHKSLYDMIDSIPLGDVPWEPLTLHYTDIIDSEEAPPAWKLADYDVWYRDPRAVIQHILANPDFKEEIDYTPIRDHVPQKDGGGLRRKDFMSGDWAWAQAANSDCRRPRDSWFDVCADYPRQRQDHGFCGDRTQ
ncbi:hypothetical protein CERSUDRAFT_96900 [Gelatoporia subvermispora B]|uniref:Uncharacterized protein n=1 Tax=Ceriporiopsis subvermispora (strain B) TaxID=914234 RepID=M2R8H1_CERS8|nr:hypothetical protein CERSUDRAFT_96900 [Gelatoporia subvermispora B]